MNTKNSTGLIFAAFLTIFSGALSADTILPNIDPAVFGGTSLGTFGPGTYSITATGIVSLAGPVGSVTTTDNFDLGPDGVPITAVTFPNYLYFNPNGSPTAGGNFGPGGASINLGAVMGTFLANPSSPTDWFIIGHGTTVTLGASETIYAAVNDTYYPNNYGSFDVVVDQVPIPAAAWLFGSALLGLAVVSRRKRA